jgi:hypothetical protein
MLRLSRLLLSVSLVIPGGSLRADEPRAISADEMLPFGQQPVDYWHPASHDPIADLQRRLADNELELPFEERFGYLPAVLKALDVPVESQLLRFRSGSPHKTHITAERPRAIYFNDDVSVAWHPGAVLLELAAQDAQKGTLFYTLTNRSEAPLEFHRSSSQACLGCHHKRGPTGPLVPGHFIQAQLGEHAKEFFYGSVKTHAAPLELRWEASYITGLNPTQRHRGNLSRPDDTRRNADDPTFHRPIVDLADEFDTDRYLTNTSDAAAHLVFDHQMLGHNLLNRLSYEHQLGVRSDVEDHVVRYLLLADETPLKQPLAGKSRFAERYSRHSPLHELDLETRLYRHRLSPLLTGRMVQGFPLALKQRLFSRLSNVLTGKESLDGFFVSDVDRLAMLEIVKTNVKDWP